MKEEIVKAKSNSSVKVAVTCNFRKKTNLEGNLENMRTMANLKLERANGSTQDSNNI